MTIDDLAGSRSDSSSTELGLESESRPTTPIMSIRIPPSPTKSISLRAPPPRVKRPLTSPVNLTRSSESENTEIMIPSSGEVTRPIFAIPPLKQPIIRTAPAPPPSRRRNRAGPVISPPTFVIEAEPLPTIEVSTSAPISPEPLIAPPTIVPIEKRPASPRDRTTITLHGIPLDPFMLDPIEPITTDPATTDVPTTPPNPSAFTPVSTDTTDIDLLRFESDPSAEPMVFPALPTTQMSLSREELSVEALPPWPVMDSTLDQTEAIIAPAPPIASLNMTRPSTSRIPSGRGRKALPTIDQPTLETSRSTIPPALSYSTPLPAGPPPRAGIPLAANQSIPPPVRSATPTSHSIPPPASHSIPTSHSIPPPASHAIPSPASHAIPLPASHAIPPASHAIPPPASHAIPPPASHAIPPPASHAIPPPASHAIPPASHAIPPPASHAIPPASQQYQNSGYQTQGHPPPPHSDPYDRGLGSPKSHNRMEIADTEPIPTGPLPAMAGATLPPPNVPDYAAMTSPEQAQHRATFRTRFGILRNAWPNYHIPDLPETMPLEEIHAQYDIYVRHIHISQEVDKYKVYIVIMFLLIELFLTKIGLNVGGYTVAQMRSMNKYERLLIELGETNYRTSGGVEGSPQSQWPVEFRLFFMALVNAVTFIIIKMLANYIGEGMANTVVDALSSYLSGSPPQPGQVLFGSGNGAAVSSVSNPGASSNLQPGGQPLPETNNPFGGFDIASMIANFGTMFINGQRPNNNAAAAPRPAQAPSQMPSAPTTPRFRPAYAE